MFDLQNTIIPKPQQIKSGDKEIKIGKLLNSDCYIEAAGCGDIFEEGVSYLKRNLLEKFTATELSGSYKISLSINKNDLRFAENAKSESYIININEDGAELVGFDEAGCYYAAITFIKLVHTFEENVFVPECCIYDYPHFSKRGHFMESRYGSDFLTLDDWKDGIDYFSEMKINTLVLSVYGCWNRQYDGDFAEYQYIPYKKYPQLKTPRNVKYYSVEDRKYIYKKDVLPVMYETDYLGKLISYAKKKNVTVFPLFNSPGHNTLLPRLFPEISAVDENGNYSKLGYCTNNEKTYEILFDIYDEIIDRYLAPNGIDSFHVGLDEVWPLLGVNENDLQEERSPFCKCEKCKNMSHSKIMFEYLIKIAKHLKEKGMKNVYVYHDMFNIIFFKENTSFEEIKNILIEEGLDDVLVIDWWSYAGKGSVLGGRGDLLPDTFRSIGKPITGYFHWTMPTQFHENVYAITDVAVKKNYEGIVAYSSFEYCYDYNYSVFADCAWNPVECAKDNATLLRYAKKAFPENVAGAMEAIKCADDFMRGRYIYKNYCATLFEYYTSSYLSKDLPYPQDYPAKQFRAIRDDEEDKYIPYLRDVYAKSSKVYEFFKDMTHREGNIWKLIALTYKTLSDEFLTIYNTAKAYSENLVDEFTFISELERLIAGREELMALCQKVRIKANTITQLRNMSIIRQFMVDLLEYMKAEVKKGNRPEVDIFSFGKYLSGVSTFLR